MAIINYSIIIPHYNIPYLLPRALDSIPQRDDIEVIVVDDCSNPSVVDFDHFPGLERPNTTCVFQKQNGGAGVSRNVAISMARGKWILCIDSDDFLLPHAFEVIDRYKENDADVVVFKAESRMSDDLTIEAQRNHASQLCELIDECLMGKRTASDVVFSVWAPWCKLVKRSMLIDNNIQFPPTPCSEDIMWSVEVAVCCRKAEVCGDYIYCLTEREGSLADDAHLVQHSIWGIKLLSERNRYLHRHHLEQYYFYFTYDELMRLRNFGVFTYLQFCYKAFRAHILRPCTMYVIEAKLHFKYPYLFLLFGLLNFPTIDKDSRIYELWKKLR